MCRNSHRDTLPLICSKTPVLSILALIWKVTLDVSGSFVHSVGSTWLLRKVSEAGAALRLISIWCLTGEKQTSRVCGYSQWGTFNGSQKKSLSHEKITNEAKEGQEWGRGRLALKKGSLTEGPDCLHGVMKVVSEVDWELAEWQNSEGCHQRRWV